MLQEETIQSHHYGERIFFNATEYFSNKMRKSTTADDKLPLTFTNVHSFKFLSETPGTMYVKFSLHGEAAPVTFAKRGRPADVQLIHKYKEPIPVDSKKFKDVQFIPRVHHSF